MTREPTPAGWDEVLPARPGLVMALFRARGSDAGDRVAAAVTGLVQASTGRVGMIDIDVNARPALAARYYVTQTPTILLLRDGAVVDRVIGTATRSVLERLLKTRAPRDGAGPLDSLFRRETPCSVWEHARGGASTTPRKRDAHMWHRS